MSRAVQATDAEARRWQKNLVKAGKPGPSRQEVTEAMQVIADWCQARGYCGAYVTAASIGSFYKTPPLLQPEAAP